MTQEGHNGSRSAIRATAAEPADKLVGAWRAPGARPSPPSVATPDHLLRMLWRSRWILLLCTVGSVGAGFAYLARCTPIFTSTSKLYVQQKTIGPPGVDIRFVPRYNLYTQAELIKSTSVLSVAVQDTALQGLRTFAGTANPIAYLQRNVHVAVGKNDDIITVSLDSPYPAEAAQIVNAVANAYITDHEAHMQRSSTDLLSNLRSKLDESHAERDKAFQELTNFKKDNPSLALQSDQGANVLQPYQRLQAAYTEAKLQSVAADSYKQRMMALADHPSSLRSFVQTGAGAAAGAAAGERSQLESKLFEKTIQSQLDHKELTPNHTRVQNEDAEIERIKARIAAIDAETAAAVLADAEQRCTEARRNEEQTAALLEQERQRVVAQSAQLNEYNRLNEAYLRSKESCQNLEQEIRTVGQNGDFEAQEIRILELARTPSRPSRPQRPRILAMSLILGLLSGGAGSLLRDLLDQAIRSADEIQRVLGLPVLGVVPTMSDRQKVSWRGQIARLQPESVEAEAFRTIRTALFFGTGKETAKTILVTSPLAGDGKSTVVSNLAIAMAQAGQKTIILDADLRKPSQHVIFGTSQDGQGLRAVLSGRAALAQVIRPTEVPGLSLLLGGPNVSHPAETLSRPAFAQLLKRLAQVYDRVIVDAPAVMVVADARVLGALCDIAVLVLHADESRRHISQRAVDALRATGTQVLGAVVNGVRRRGDCYGYYGDIRGHYTSSRHADTAAKRPQAEACRDGRASLTVSLSKGGAVT